MNIDFIRQNKIVDIIFAIGAILHVYYLLLSRPFKDFLHQTCLIVVHLFPIFMTIRKAYCALDFANICMLYAIYIYTGCVLNISEFILYVLILLDT